MKYDYLANDISFSDYDAVKRRIASVGAARKGQARMEMHAEYTRSVRRAAPTAKPAGSSLSSLASMVGSSSFQIGFAGVLTAGMVGFFGLLASDAIDARKEAALYGQCRANDMNYVTRSGSYCADRQKFAHQITADGVTGRLSFDWRINESVLRDAETQASHK